MSDWDAFPLVDAPRPQAQPRPSPQRQAAPRAAPRPQIRFADDLDAVTRTILGEAGSEDETGKLAVGAVIRNRSRHRGLTPQQVVLETNQFEPWGNDDTARRLLQVSPNSPEYRQARALAERAMAGEDPTQGASHFYAPKAQAALGRQAPSWDNGSGYDIGNHRFFRLDGTPDVAADKYASDAALASAPAGDWSEFEVVDEFPQDKRSGVYTDENGFVVDTETRWGTQQHPWSPDQLQIAIANSEDPTKMAGDYVRYQGQADPYSGQRETKYGQYNPIASFGGTRIPQENGAEIAEASVFEKPLAATLAANEQMPGSVDLMALERAILEGKSWGEARQDIRDLKANDRATMQDARNVGGVLGFGGTMLLPAAGAGYVANATSKADKIGRLGLLGTGSGALYGFGTSDGNLTERLAAGAQDALISGGVATVAPFAVPAAIAAAKGTGRVATEAPARVASGVSEVGATVGRALGREAPEAVVREGNTMSAAQYVERLLSRSGAEQTPDTRGLLTMAESIGPSGVAHVNALTRRSGRTGNEAAKILGARSGDMGTRVLSDFESVTGIAPTAGRDGVEAIAKAGRERAAPLYNEAYSMPAEMTDNLTAILSTPSGKAALGRAARIAGDEMRNPNELGFIFNEAGEAVELATPTMQTLDYVKRGLDSVLDDARNPITGRLQVDNRTRPIVGLAEKLRSELIEQTGGETGPYARALSEAGDAIRIEQAIDQAPKLFSQAVNGRQFDAAIERMGEAERQALVAGFGEKLMNDVQAGKLSVAQLNRLDVPATREKLGRLIGDEAATNLFSRVRSEVEMGRTGSRMMPNTNSVTGEIAQASSEMEGSGLAENAIDAIRRGGLLSAVAEATVAPVKAFARGATTPAPQATRDEIGRLLLMPREEAMAEINRIRNGASKPASAGLLSLPPSRPR